MNLENGDHGVEAIRWLGDRLELLDQRQLPGTVTYLSVTTMEQAVAAIRDMVVRGAPAIGITAAYAVVLAARTAPRQTPTEEHLSALIAARPTAVNLAWAVQRMRQVAGGAGEDRLARLEEEACRIHAEDIRANRAMGDVGAALMDSGARVLTHCNAGALATGGYGTALGVVRSAHRQSKLGRVFADETRPWLQGARLTAWELLADGIPVTLLPDAAAPALMSRDGLDWVVVGADRIAANGDVANKIGTYGLAVAARRHGVRFMVAAPTSTIDLNTPVGDDIPIEERASEEVLAFAQQQVAPAGAQAYNPVFDVTPASLIDVIVTEKGAVHEPNSAKILALMSSGPAAS